MGAGARPGSSYLGRWAQPNVAGFYFGCGDYSSGVALTYGIYRWAPHVTGHEGIRPLASRRGSISGHQGRSPLVIFFSPSHQNQKNPRTPFPSLFFLSLFLFLLFPYFFCLLYIFGLFPYLPSLHHLLFRPLLVVLFR
ncbi:hypothetical protein K456DRAFT_328285 [Colletotrichum gloeosporioides 23]|nr:hypothetical protein K456DRAFT_328285 [Colletotrichum gloeosporioides 23]